MANITVEYGTVEMKLNEQTVSHIVTFNSTIKERIVGFTFEDLKSVVGLKDFVVSEDSTTHITNVVIEGNTITATIRFSATTSYTEQEVSITAVGV